MIALIVAVAENGIIGKDGKMPWRIPGELKRFRELTTGNVVVMGRRTFEAVGCQPLPDRTNIIVSRTMEDSKEDYLVARSLEEAIAMAGNQDVYITGGSGLYKESLPLVEKMYITEVHKEFEGDTWFPKFDESQFVKTVDEYHEGEIPYTYVTYTRK